MDSNNVLEYKIDATATIAKDADTTIKSLQTKLNQQEGIIMQQGKLIAEAEAYLKGYNLKFFNIPEILQESRDDLLLKFYDMCHTIEVDSSQL